MLQKVTNTKHLHNLGRAGRLVFLHKPSHYNPILTLRRYFAGYFSEKLNANHVI